MADKWTSADEKEFGKLQEKLTHMNARRAARGRQVREVVIRTKLNEGGTDDIVTALIANADAFRDALEPFDSGVRVKDDVAKAPKLSIEARLTDNKHPGAINQYRLSNGATIHLTSFDARANGFKDKAFDDAFEADRNA